VHTWIQETLVVQVAVARQAAASRSGYALPVCYTSIGSTTKQAHIHSMSS
jgi:hypothetical protein